MQKYGILDHKRVVYVKQVVYEHARQYLLDENGNEEIDADPNDILFLIYEAKEATEIAESGAGDKELEPIAVVGDHELAFVAARLNDFRPFHAH